MPPTPPTQDRRCCTTDSKLSHLTDLLDSYHSQCNRLDDLEKRLDEFSIRQRRRVANLLEQTPSHRRSHMRLFVTHQFDNNHHHNHLNADSQWTLVLEGKLLVGHLDHQSAARVEDAAIQKAKEAGVVVPAVVVVDSSTSPPITPLARSTDRSQYRSVGEREEDPVEAINFTHFFDAVNFDFQTVFQPAFLPEPVAKKLTPTKKSRSKRKHSSADTDDTRSTIDPALLTLSPTTTLQWSKTLSDDSNAFFVRYVQPHPLPLTLTHSVVATITLTPSVPEDTYKPSVALASAFFPKHLAASRNNNPNEPSNKRRKGTDGEVALDANAIERSIPLEYETIVPGTLSLNEIVTALSQYAIDKQLFDESDKSVLHNDTLLQSLFDCETMKFADLKGLLLSRDLISANKLDPIVITYIMTEQTASPSQALGTPQSGIDEKNPSAQMLSFDIDVFVPSLFPYRARELLRRIKKREFEYTSSRTKARYLMMGSNKNNEEAVKSRIEQAVCGKGFSSEHIPVFLALAKSAPALSEARAAGQIDAKLCVLLESVQQRCKVAQAAWDLVQRFQGVNDPSSPKSV